MDKVRDIWVRVTLILALLLPVYFLVAAFGTKFGLIDWRVGFGQMTFRLGPQIMIGVGVLALIGLVMAVFTPPRRGVLAMLLALAIPAAGIGYGMYVREQASGVPPIHDITTDMMDPPSFSASVVEARAAVPGVNSLDLGEKRSGDGRPFTEMQQEAYSDIDSIPTGLSPEQAFDQALALAREEQGWRLGQVDRAAGLIEATEQSFWYGFTDDIVVRIRPDGSGARIDMRSVSRVGRSDLGVNAARMRPYLEELRRRVAEAES